MHECYNDSILTNSLTDITVLSYAASELLRNVTYVVNELQCTGTESKLLNCSLSVVEDCDLAVVAGLMCEGSIPFVSGDYLLTKYLFSHL